MKDIKRIVLASSSPRRRDLMEASGLDFETREPVADEISEGRPEEIVVENARRKALSIPGSKGDIIIGCDTIGECNGQILSKPVDIDDARRMLHLQQEYPSHVISGIAIHDVEKGRTFYGFEVSTVTMDGGGNGVEEYLSTGQWKGKAGAFGIQDRGPIGARIVSGEEDNVIGLPMTLLKRLLSLVGFEYPERTPAGS